ncbi:MAG: hypothetical protein ABIN95_02140 [Mucilaginibacter sp.]
MSPVIKQFKKIVFTILLIPVMVLVFAQVKPKAPSEQFTTFKRLTAQANVIFTPQPGFREIKALNNEDFTFDYAMELPGHEFEVWYMVRSQKENWASYERALSDDKLKLANPDSVYIDMGQAHAIAFTGERHSFIKMLPPPVLKRYHADAGRSHLLNLLDMPETKRYQYALLLSLQKFHTGTILMVCFTNNKSPEFYKNVERAGSSLKFKPAPQNVSKLAD